MRFAFSGHLETKGRGRLRSTEDLIEFSERRAMRIAMSESDRRTSRNDVVYQMLVVPGAYGAQARLSYEARSL